MFLTILRFILRLPFTVVFTVCWPLLFLTGFAMGESPSDALRMSNDLWLFVAIGKERF